MMLQLMCPIFYHNMLTNSTDYSNPAFYRMHSIECYVGSEVSDVPAMCWIA